MGNLLFYSAAATDACRCAREVLASSGIPFSRDPDPGISDLLLDVPSFSSPGILRNGEAIAPLLAQLPEKIRIWGGRLCSLKNHYETIDLLEDSAYLAENAFITADCALRLCGPCLQTTWKDTAVLVIGWGRIGKHLCRMLKALGAEVTVFARNPYDRALLNAFGYRTIDASQLFGDPYQVIFNTVPAVMMDASALGTCPVPIDLASVSGLLGPQVLSARGLPGIHAPITSGRLIARSILNHVKGGE